MLVLSRKPGQALRIGAHIEIRVVALQGGQVRLAIKAPPEVSIHREEIYQRIAQANREASHGDPDSLRALTARGADSRDEEGS